MDGRACKNLGLMNGFFELQATWLYEDAQCLSMLFRELTASLEPYTDIRL